MLFAWLGECWKRWEIRKREEAIRRHLGFLFERFGGSVSRISYENNASQFWILFGNVAFDYYAHMGDAGAFVAPAHDLRNRHDLNAVLRFLAKETEWKPQIRGLSALAMRLAPHAEELNRRFGPKEYPQFREELERYHLRD